MSDEVADGPEWQHATESLHNMLTSVSQFIDSMDAIGICPDIVATLTRAGLIHEPHPHPHPDALADPFYSAAPSASAPDPPPAASATGSMSPHKRRASTEEPDMFPSRNYAPFNGTHRLQCCHCGTLDSRFSWRYWMKDKTFRLCSKCNGRFERRLRTTKKQVRVAAPLPPLSIHSDGAPSPTTSQPMDDDEEDEGVEEGAEVDEEDADEERIVSTSAGRKGKGKARDDTGSRAPGSSSSSSHNNNNNSSSSTSSRRRRGAIPAQRTGAGDGGSSSSARTPRGAAPPRTGSRTAQRGRPAAGTAAEAVAEAAEAAAAAQRTLRSDDAQDGDGRIGTGTGTDERGGGAADPAARASVEEGRDAVPPPSVPRKIASALSSSPDRLEEQTSGGADLPSDAELEDNPLLSITAPPSFRLPIASSRSGGAPAGGAPAGGAGAPAAAASRSAAGGAAASRSAAGGAAASRSAAPAAAASRSAAPAATASRATRTPTTRTPATRARGLRDIYEDSDDGDASPTRRLGPRGEAPGPRRP
ncbi:hypothetical protein OC842_007295 [Tilletia horrida]|uniref:Uncharacterized protein n=1 Tax=Tilletia horrida TaxID=155126 RepID=A0AAN6JML0_9BASI|nr:hypothetical protein OC842_007295 [Tilletia horrida]